MVKLAFDDPELLTSLGFLMQGPNDEASYAGRAQHHELKVNLSAT